MSFSPAQQNARLGTALAALAMRYFELVAQQSDSQAAEVRRAFTTLYLSRGGRAALVALGIPTAALPTTISTAGWNTNLRTATQGSIRVAVSASVPVLQTMPTAFSALGAWWRGGAGAQLMGMLQLNALEILMDLEGVPAQQAALLAAVDDFTAGPGLPINDPWVDEAPTQSVQAAATAIAQGSTAQSSPASPAPRRCPTGFVRVSGECVASVEAGGTGITSSDAFDVRGRTSGEFPLWATLLLTGLGVGGVAWFVLANKKRRRR